MGEWLRQWCDQAGRTPRPDEQAAIAHHQQHLIDQAAALHDLVVCDTTPLMTAVYSGLLFDDRSLDRYALEQQRRCHLTLLTALDIAWVAAGLQRDGPQVRTQDAVAPLLRQHAAPSPGLISRLNGRDAQAARWRWLCSDCDVPDCERRLLQPGAGHR